MSTRSRLWFWAAGLLVVAASAALDAWPEGWRTLGPIGALLGLAFAGMVAELLAGVAALRRRPVRVRAADAAPADGRVEWLTIPGLRDRPNPDDPRCRRFVALEPRPESPRATPRPEFPALWGRVALVSIFVGRDGTGWSDREVAGAHAALERAGAWIEREAIRWGAAVNVALAATYFEAIDEVPEAAVELGLHDGQVGPVLDEVGSEERALASASRASRNLGFRDVADLMGAVEGRVAADLIVWLIHLRRAGGSLAVTADRAPIPGVAAAVCFALESDEPGPLGRRAPAPDPVTFVHELLHLFGARDKYEAPLHAYPRGSLTERDVMVLEFASLPRLRVDPLTAVEIGWAADPAARPVEPRPNANRPPRPRKGRGGR